LRAYKRRACKDGNETKWEDQVGGFSMRRVVVSLFAACAALTVPGAVLAQAPAPAAPAAVPDQMPFDIPYGAAITADRAAQVAAAAAAEAKKSPRNWKLAIAVVDPNGDLVYFYKMDQTQVASINIAQGKARTAARFRRPSGAFFNIMQTPAGAFASTLDPTLVASHGGFPLVEGGKIVGAIGCSGATGDQDGVACKAGADSVK
jgi:glc operon protein GlcG